MKGRWHDGFKQEETEETESFRTFLCCLCSLLFDSLPGSTARVGGELLFPGRHGRAASKYRSHHYSRRQPLRQRAMGHGGKHVQFHDNRGRGQHHQHAERFLRRARLWSPGIALRDLCPQRHEYLFRCAAHHARQSLLVPHQHKHPALPFSDGCNDSNQRDERYYRHDKRAGSAGHHPFH